MGGMWNLAHPQVADFRHDREAGSGELERLRGLADVLHHHRLGLEVNLCARGARLKAAAAARAALALHAVLLTLADHAGQAAAQDTKGVAGDLGAAVDLGAIGLKPDSRRAERGEVCARIARRP